MDIIADNVPNWVQLHMTHPSSHVPHSLIFHLSRFDKELGLQATPGEIIILTWFFNLGIHSIIHHIYKIFSIWDINKVHMENLIQPQCLLKRNLWMSRFWMLHRSLMLPSHSYYLQAGIINNRVDIYEGLSKPEIIEKWQ
jgi:hypothetical protein